MKTTLRTGLLTVEDAGWQWDGAYLPRHGPSPLPPGRGIFYLLNIMPVSSDKKDGIFFSLRWYLFLYKMVSFFSGAIAPVV
ncbi:hypothetical protein ACG2F4_05560 [Halalkalibaculum sp. DA3122]|uniref:hypothetical protein n=1 Tax=Halalkalibaculum sp. DA3122 TaxID=3373607 RepID=UPI003753F23B